MFLSGIADEAARDIERQIEAHRQLGWKHIEMRNVSGKNLTDVDDATFESIAALLVDAGLEISCYASQLANWSRPINSDFAVDIAEIERAIPRMHRTRTRFIRAMSYPNSDPPLEDREWRKAAVHRLKELARRAEDGGVTIVHENCSGWGGQGPKASMDLLADVGSDAFRLVFDTGNPVQEFQDSWAYYQGTREGTVYVHIKDYLPRERGEPERACFPGEGAGRVRDIIRDLLANGYDGGFSIEPHITSVIHLNQEASDPELAFRTYLEYGRRLEKLVDEIRAEI